MTFLLLLFLGLIAGTLAGLFGIGGGILFTPILFLFFSHHGVENPVVWTIGSSLFCTFIASASSTFQQLFQHNLFLKEGLKVGLLGAVGVFIGKLIVTSPFYTEKVFVILFALLLLVVAVLFYRRGKANVDVTSNPDKVSWKKSMVTGGLGGIIASLAGVGGGVIMVPIMNLWFKVELNRTVSISSLAIVVISLSGWLQFALFADGGTGLTRFTLGAVDFGSALPIVIGAFFGGIAGARINQKVSDNLVQIGFSFLVIAVAGMMIYNLF